MSEVFSGVFVTRCDGSVWCAVIWNQGGLRSGRAGWKHSAPWRDRPCKEQLLLLKQQRGRCGVIYHAARTHLVLTREDAPTGRTCSWSSREASQGVLSVPEAQAAAAAVIGAPGQPYRGWKRHSGMRQCEGLQRV